MNISIDTNLFIDLFQADREHAHSLLDSITSQKEALSTSKNKEQIKFVIHIKQLEEILYKLEELIGENELDMNDINDAKSLHTYLETLKNLEITSPNILKEKNIMIGNPNGEDTHVNRLAREAIDLSPTIRRLHKEFEMEVTDSVIVAFAKKTKAYLFSRDTHINLMTKFLLKEEGSTPKPLWVNQEEKNYPIFVNPQNKKIIKYKQKLSPKERIEKLIN